MDLGEVRGIPLWLCNWGAIFWVWELQGRAVEIDGTSVSISRWENWVGGSRVQTDSSRTSDSERLLIFKEESSKKRTGLRQEMCSGAIEEATKPALSLMYTLVLLSNWGVGAGLRMKLTMGCGSVREEEI